MNSIKKFLLRMAGLHLEPHVEPEPVEKGVLFGLDPPEGCYFDVDYYHPPSSGTASWHVAIKTKAENTTLGSACTLKSTNLYGPQTDEEAIKRAAEKALTHYWQRLSDKRMIEERKKLCGQYPPKRTP